MTSAQEQATAMRTLARAYLALGINIVPLGGDKRPVITGVGAAGQPLRFRWEDWQTTRQAGNLLSQLFRPAWWADVQGIGGICGPVSNGLVCVDFDDIEENLLSLFLLRLESHESIDHRWSVRTAHGRHFWLRCPELEIAKGVLNRPARHGPGHVELRYSGHYAALPGSAHPSGNRYEWLLQQPEDLPSIVSAASLLAAYEDITTTPKSEPIVVAHQSGTATALVAHQYAQQALVNECIIVQRAAVGTRNHALNTAAYNLGQLVSGAVLAEDDVVNALTLTALQIGLSESEVHATIRSGLDAGRKQPRQPRDNGAAPALAGYDGFSGETPEPIAIDHETEPAHAHRSWPYAIKDGRMCFCWEKDGEIERKPIADFYARVVEEVHNEDGSKLFSVAGTALRSGSFALDVPALDFGDERKLKALLDAAVGARDPIYKGMAPHLTAAIKLLTGNDLPAIRRFQRTGWAGNRFLLPGLHPEDSHRIELPRKCPYHGPTETADMDVALAAFHALINSISPQLSLPILTMLLQAPLSRKLGWDGERYSIFVQGRTGSLKTSWSQTAMCLYGENFADESMLVKWGEGATRNAIMSLAAYACDMPFLIDNYKPNTGDGAHAFKNLVQTISEGSDKDRLTRSSMLRDARPLHCFPLMTGEDIPLDDAASVARVLIVRFDQHNGQVNNELATAQRLCAHLPAIGAAWLTWLEQQQFTENDTDFRERQAFWAEQLTVTRKDLPNASRIATNLATNELTFRMALRHPIIGPTLLPYATTHTAGLMRIAIAMATQTADAGEAQQFVNALRELLVTGQYILQPRGVEPSDLVKDRLLGWHDDAGVYLLPAITLNAVKRLLGPQAIPGSIQSLYNQMDGLGWIASKGNGHITRLLRIGTAVQRVLHLHWSALRYVDNDTDTTIESLGL